MSSLDFIMIDIIVLLISLVIFFGYRYKLLQVHNLEITNNNHNLVWMIQSIPVIWCGWYMGDNKVFCSNEFKKKFNLDLYNELLVNDILEIFGKDSFSHFHKALKHLFSFGGDFCLQLSLNINQAFELEITGQAIVFDNAAKDKKQFIILLINDITQDIAEKKRQQVEQKTQEIELEILRNFARYTPFAFWARDALGRINYCNNVYALALQTTEARVIAESIELIPNFTAHNLSQSAIKNNSKEMLNQHVVLQGERRLLEITEVAVNSNKIATIGYALDISNLDAMEQELQLKTKAQEDFLNSLSTPIAFYNADAKLDFFNTAYVKSFQLDEKWLYSKPFLGDVLDELRRLRKIPEYTDFLSYKNNNLQLFKSIFEPIYELLYLPDGKILKMTIAHNLTGGLFYIFEDMTDKLALERGYNALIAVQKETIDHLNEGLMVLGSDFKVRIINYSMQDILGLRDYKFANNCHLKDVFKEIKHLFIDDQEHSNFLRNLQLLLDERKEYSGNLVLSAEKKLKYSYVPLPDGSHLLIFVDNSEALGFEKIIKDRELALDQAYRFKENFVDYIAYELQNPLSTISGFLDILINQYFGELNEKQIDYCQSISQSLKKLDMLVNDISNLTTFNLSTLEDSNFDSIDLNLFLNSLKDLANNRANNQGVAIMIENKADIKNFYGNTTQLKHALFNILNNAIKFTNSGGSITLKSEVINQNILLSIIDTGVGIPSYELKQLKKELYNDHQNDFVHLKGLQFANKIIRNHRGILEIESIENQGTIVVCRIPLNIPI